MFYYIYIFGTSNDIYLKIWLFIKLGKHKTE